MRASFALAALLGTVGSANASVVVSTRHPVDVVVQPGATAPERLAARELVAGLRSITGATVRVVETDAPRPNSIVVGPGPVARRVFPEVDLSRFGAEEVAIRSKGDYLLVAGGRERGTVYAVNRLLHRQGVRWWTPWATTVPKRASLEFNDLNVREAPRFEYRSPFWYHAFDRDWSRRNYANGHHHAVTAEDGGKVTYQEFVHTFYPLVPPEKYFKAHPEWYSLVDGKRRSEGAQLCTTNPELRDFVVQRVREWLREHPTATIVSVSQNDCFNPCQCENCKALDDAEGTHAASVLALANYVAEKIAPDYPNVAIDTLAYQYTRKAPRTMRPRPNVIVRLCSIECNFAQPLTHPSNASFANDIRDWSRLTNRLYVWNYVTDFPHYMLPFPNWYVVGPNQRFFAQNGVRGLFEQGAYQSFGASMAEMEAWVQAQLLWDPNQNDRKLMTEFLRGYYGKAAAPVEAYLDLIARAAQSHETGIWVGPDAPFFDASTVLRADQLWGEAERRVAKDPDLLWRVRQGRLPIRYVALSRWNGLRSEAARKKIAWTLPESRRAVADAWMAAATGKGPAGWSPITHLSEAGLKPESWIARFAVDPEPVHLPGRVANRPLPADLTVPPGAEVVDVQDDEAKLYGEGDLAELRPDPAASDGIACRMPGTHYEWAFQMPVKKMPVAVQKGRWRVYAVVRVEPGADPKAEAFTAGLYREETRETIGGSRVTSAQAGTGYRTYLLATTELTPNTYVWIAPSGNGKAKAVWVDRVILVREP
jgi:hypothetical protein